MRDKDSGRRRGRAGHPAAMAGGRVSRDGRSGRAAGSDPPTLPRGGGQRVGGAPEDAGAVAVGKRLHPRVGAHPLQESLRLPGQERLAALVEAAGPLLGIAVRAEDRADLGHELRRGAGDQQRGDGAVIDANPSHHGERLAAARLPRRGQQDLLLERDVAEEPGAEGVVGGPVHLARSLGSPGEEGVEPAVVRGEEAGDGTGR